MFSDVDETIRALLVGDIPIERDEIDISFDRPTREWSSRLSKPTLNLFLADVRERAELRDQAPWQQRDATGAIVARPKPRRVDLAYIISAWTREPGDEHRILASVLACIFRHKQVPDEYLQGSLTNAEYPVLLRYMPPDYLMKGVDLWSVMDNEIRASLTWVATAPLDVLAPVAGPLVRTREIGVGPRDETWREKLIRVAGVVHRPGDPLDGVAGVRVRVKGTALEAVTDREGRFAFSGMPPADYAWEVELDDGRRVERSITVPSSSYDIEI
ncbi:MAG: hypothetical protein Kow0010_06170 [Dehalococcoidia bacterium]